MATDVQHSFDDDIAMNRFPRLIEANAYLIEVSMNIGTKEYLHFLSNISTRHLQLYLFSVGHDELFVDEIFQYLFPVGLVKLESCLDHFRILRKGTIKEHIH